MYIVSYISKAEREMGTLLKLALQEARDGNLDAMSELRQLGTVYLNHREVSLMEAVYRVTGMHFKKTSRKVVYIPLDPNAQRITLPLAVIQNKQEDTEEIWADNIIDKYLARPKTECFLNMCLAIFASDHSTHRANPSDSSVMLESDLGYIKPRSSKRCIIRYCRTKAEKDPEKYYHGLLRLYLPHVHMEIRSDTTQTYEHFFLNGQIKLGKETRQVKDIVIHNMSQFETITEEMDEAWETIQHSLPNDNAWCDTQILNTSGTEAENEDESVFDNGILKSCEQIPELTACGNMLSTHSNTKMPYIPLGQETLNTLRVKYEHLQVIIIDEISMVDVDMLSYINCRLQQIKGSSMHEPFGNVSILAVGDFYQLPPIRGKPLFDIDPGALVKLWSIFYKWQLDEIMRQKEDEHFANLLNRVRVLTKGEQLLDDNKSILMQRLISTLGDYPQNDLHIFSRNIDVDEHNHYMLTQTLLKATLYDSGKLNVMSVEATVMIGNYILKPDKSVTLTTASKVFRCSDMSIDEKFQSIADELINPPPKPIEPCKKVKFSPPKTMTSVQGKIIKDEAIKQVIVRGQTSAVRNIFVKDNSDEIEVALWRNAAETKASLNDWVEITNVVVNPPNDYHTEPFVAQLKTLTLQTKRKRDKSRRQQEMVTEIRVKAAPSITVEAEIVACTIENELFKVLPTTSDDTTPREYSLSEDILRQILLLPSTISLQELQTILADEIPLKTTFIMQNEVIIPCITIYVIVFCMELQTTLADEIPLTTTLIMQNDVIIAAQTSEGRLESDA
ncbi:ATP-dependent DNA helicase PIF1 [Holothuria leucospilota]|uniref:ATP-dependent DNA helicase n=1 Tax=Holothuria leucospilota TaxID=206669 RepID=A0A9Q1CRZ8_HOLLE|nr:ATP-dependent DNA helicase PIF1 [Holothuria leucospilota]